MEKRKVNAVSKIRRTFEQEKKPLTIAELNIFLPECKPSELSMGLCYLLKLNQVSREQIPNSKKLGRKLLWQYTYTKESVNV